MFLFCNNPKDLTNENTDILVVSIIDKYTLNWSISQQTIIQDENYDQLKILIKKDKKTTLDIIEKIQNRTQLNAIICDRKLKTGDVAYLFLEGVLPVRDWLHIRFDVYSNDCKYSPQLLEMLEDNNIDTSKDLKKEYLIRNR